jgi:hypothetical protein
MKVKSFRLQQDYRANVLAQTLCLLINCGYFYFTSHYAAIWAEVCALCFIGSIDAQPKRGIVDVNLLNHFLVVFLYYLVATVALKVEAGYLVVLFLFTYMFFIFKDSGFDKSINMWVYIQCLAFPTTLTNLSVSAKLLATVVGYLEAQLVVYIFFKLFPSIALYKKESYLLSYKNLRQLGWFKWQQIKVKLALRGSIVAAILYIVCLLNTRDIKPNWAVIAAISCLTRADNLTSRKMIIAILFGTAIGFALSWLMITLNIKNGELLLAILWLILVLVIICVLEYRITESIYTQIIGVSLITVALTCLYFLLDFDSKFYLQLRVVNNLLGIAAAIAAYFIWQLVYKAPKNTKVNG